jgi:hypothetical protein
MLSNRAQKTAKHDQIRNFKKRIGVLGIQDLGGGAATMLKGKTVHIICAFFAG